MKHVLIVALLVSLVLAVRYRSWSDPSVVLTRFLDAWYEQDLEEVYEHLCAADRAHRSLEKYIKLHGTEDSIVVAPLLERSTFEIESLEVDAARARAQVSVSEPDMSFVMDDMMNEVLRASGSGASHVDFESGLERRYAHRRVPMQTRQKVYELVLEEDRWKIDLHWPLESKIGSLLMRGARRERQRDLKGAQEDYQAALVLDDTQVELQKEIDRLAFEMLPQAEQTRIGREAMDAAFYKILRGSGR